MISENRSWTDGGYGVLSPFHRKPRFHHPRTMTQPSSEGRAPFASRSFPISDSSLQAPEPRFVSATVFGFSHYKARLTRQQHDCVAQHWQNETWFPTSRVDIVILLPASKHKYNNLLFVLNDLIVANTLPSKKSNALAFAFQYREKTQQDMIVLEGVKNLYKGVARTRFHGLKAFHGLSPVGNIQTGWLNHGQFCLAVLMPARY